MYASRRRKYPGFTQFLSNLVTRDSGQYQMLSCLKKVKKIRKGYCQNLRMLAEYYKDVE